MWKPLAPVLICLMAATAAVAQPGGGGHRRGGGGPSHGSGPTPSAAAPRPAQTPVNRLEIVGVIKAIDTATGRVTIAYEPVEALNWPAGTQPFPVAKTALLKGAAVGEKVRFSVDGGQVSALRPF